MKSIGEMKFEKRENQKKSPRSKSLGPTHIPFG